MGKAMSALVSTAVRPLRDYNVEQRAHKVISQSKPKAAPKYESNEKELARILKGKKLKCVELKVSYNAL